MKHLALTSGGFTVVDDRDYEWAKTSKWYLSGGYVRRTTDKALLHKLINLTPSNKVTDHINRDVLDNRRANLRDADKSLNGLNRGLNKNNTSGHRGVVFMKNRGSKPWASRLKLRGRVFYFGYHPTYENACKAFDEAFTQLTAGENPADQL